MAVAAGLADLALAVDELGSARVPAACCGAYALRTTAGVLPLEGASCAAASLAAPALLAADPQTLLKAGQALRLPAGGRPLPWLQLHAVSMALACSGAAAALAGHSPAAAAASGPLPAGGAPTEVLSYLVAEDFFAACGEEAKAMVPAVVAAVKVGGRGLCSMRHAATCLPACCAWG